MTPQGGQLDGGKPGVVGAQKNAPAQAEDLRNRRVDAP